MSLAHPERDRRKRLLADLQHLRGSDLLVAYVTSTREGLEGAIADQSIRWLFEHLPSEGVGQIDLLVHSGGGEDHAAWRIMCLLHEYASKVSVLVPSQASGAATLLALGANEVLMHPMGAIAGAGQGVLDSLGPVDERSRRLVPVSEQDLDGYWALVREEGGLRHQHELLEAFRVLAEHVHPLVLGNVKRRSSERQALARRLIGLRANAEADDLGVLDRLAAKLCTQSRPIGRAEARQLGLPLASPHPEAEQALWELYLSYEAELQIARPFDPVQAALAAGLSIGLPEPGGEREWAVHPQPVRVPVAIIESSRQAHILEQEMQLCLSRGSDGAYLGESRVLSRRWVSCP